MKKRQSAIILLAVALAVAAVLASYIFKPGILPLRSAGTGDPAYSGTESCRECHEDFYQLWATSQHGLAMQPFTAELFNTRLAAQAEKLVIGGSAYLVEFDGKRAWIRESGPGGNRKYPMVHALGGKNVYYFLTPMDRGRLQVLPLAYDVRRRSWFDTAASGIRHFHDIEEDPVGWKDPEYTFNTSCYGCHVSQYAGNYDLKTDTYNSVWLEPGINCEACHGSGVEHVRVCREAGEGNIPEDLKIDVIRPPRFSNKLAADACSVCHAKASPLTASYRPGDDFFDHFDLGVLDLPDYYPDGRDLGENYTYTQWLMSPCARSGQMDCLHCHTSSGRFRFEDGAKNEACMPCHADNVKNASGHSRHPAGSAGSLCISCHMPMTEFARMRRSDHSMLPPAPAATMAYRSPNACNICHADKDAAWADGWVRKWRTRDYQAPVLHRASLIDAARRRDWRKLPAMIEYIGRVDRDEVFAASLIRLLRANTDARKWPVLVRAMEDPSPLVRASAAESLGDRIDPEALQALSAALRDESRLVRVRAASAMAAAPRDWLDAGTAAAFDIAAGEFKSTLDARPDHWSSHYNLGNFHLSRGDYGQAAAFFETAIRLQPRVLVPHVNVSFAYNALGLNDKAEQSLRQAREINPNSLEANLNLGLLLGEMGRLTEAESYLQNAVELDAKSGVAFYNLGMINAYLKRTDRAVEYLRRACSLDPENTQYAYSLAFYLAQSGNISGSAEILRRIVGQDATHVDAVLLLGEIYLRQGKTKESRTLYERALENVRLSPEERGILQGRITALTR
ncbi:MAG TPA: tetratricopeptide repeat protein [Acidobacteriota bacterium]|nr:tetratricopeptide repeat protein [Acidobacteriota bacterium]